MSLRHPVHMLHVETTHDKFKYTQIYTLITRQVMHVAQIHMYAYMCMCV